MPYNIERIFFLLCTLGAAGNLQGPVFACFSLAQAVFRRHHVFPDDDTNLVAQIMSDFDASGRSELPKVSAALASLRHARVCR